MSKKSAFRRLAAAALWSAFALALVFAVINWVLPWLGRRGDLNTLVENVVRSMLTVPVRIEKVDSEPLNQLTVTKLHSVGAEAKDRFRFGAQSISLRYDPVELFGGRIRATVFDAPSIFINLDADLAGIARAPELPIESDSPPPPPAAEGEPLLPIVINEARVENGLVTLQINGRLLELTEVRVTLSNLGELRGQQFQLSALALGGVIRAWGAVDIERRAGAAARLAFHQAQIVVADVDVARLLSWTAPASIAGGWLGTTLSGTRGMLSLEGSLEGVWPESVKLSLATYAGEIDAPVSDQVGLHQASVGLHVSAEVLGDLEIINFQVSTHGEGSLDRAGTDSQRGRLELSGSLQPRMGPGKLTLTPSRVILEHAGEVAFSGTVDAVLGDEATLDFELEAINIDGGVLWNRVPAALRRSLVGDIDVQGRLNATARITGPTSRPRLDGEIELVDAGLAAAGRPALGATVRTTLHGLEYDAVKSSLSAGRIRMESSAVDAASLGPALGLSGDELRAGGALIVRLEAEEQCYPPASSGWHARVEVDAEALEWALPRAGIEAAGMTGSLAIDATFYPAGRKLKASWRAAAGAGELLLGSIYAPIQDKPITSAGEVSAAWGRDGRLDTLAVDDAGVDAPYTGPVTATVRVWRGAGGDDLQVEATLEATQIPAREAFSVAFVEPLRNRVPLVESASLEGDAKLFLRLEGNAAMPGAWGRLALERGALRFAGIEARGVEIELPFEAGEPMPASPEAVGFVDIESLQLDGGGSGPVRLEFRLANGVYVTEPLGVPAHGGRIEIGAATIAPRQPSGARAEAEVRLRGLQTRKLSKAYRTTRFKGTLDADLKPLRLDGNKLEAVGTVTLHAFGGGITFKDLVLDDLAAPYAHLRLGEGRVTKLRLDRLGETFRFGVMSGVLEGSVKELAVTGGELSRFKIDLATVRTPGVAQYLDRTAIESIRRVFSGPLGAVEETFFSRFRFADFGFVASLDAGIFRLRGKHREGDKEYLMRARWYQVPQVNIINGRPNQDYDWRTIVENLRRLIERKQDP